MKISKVMILAGLMILTIYAGTAQNPKQANIWYFGIQAGLDFTHGNPVALTNSSMEAYEGTATICDHNGNLLFYTNGGDQPYTGAIWNRNHQVMPNGYLENTSGCSSSLQSSVIVKRPGSESIYYVFATDCYENGFENGLSYSVIDMSLNNGLGDLTVKGERITQYVTESLTAASHANGKDYWILTHKVNSDSFFVYHLTNTGIIGVVKTKIGPVANEFVGELRVSTNGQRLAFAGTSFMALFDFDASTGVVSNYRNLNASCFSACFSPDCQLLYGVNLLSRKIYQFDITAQDIAGSKQEVGSSPSVYIGTMQIGPDNKIYVAMRNSQYLGVITRPNIKGPNCNFIPDDIYLNGRASKYCLPNYANNILGECGRFPVENENRYVPFFSIKDIDTRRITLEVNPSEDAEKYLVSRRRVGAADWENLSFGSNVFTNEDLEENSDYEFRLDAIAYPNYTYEFIYDHVYEEVVSEQIVSDHLFRASTSDPIEFEVYPNPAIATTNVELFLKRNSKVEIIITDLGGKVILYKNAEAKSGRHQLELPLENIQSGIYHLTLKSGNNTGHRKLIVMN